MVGGMAFPRSDQANIDSKLFGVATAIKDSSDLENGFFIQFTLCYGLDHYLVPGLSAGLSLDYYSAIVDIKVDQQNVTLFNGNLLALNGIGFVPFLKARLFSLGEYLFSTQFPTSWEIYLFTGIRLNCNIYSEGDAKLKGLDSLVVTGEIGGGVEIFLTEQWAMLFQFSWYSNSTDVQVQIGGRTALTGDIDFQGVQISLGVNHYF